MGTVRWVIFDAVDTLIEPCPGVGEVYFRAGQHFGSQRTREEVGRDFRRFFVESEHACFPAQRRGRTSEAEEHQRWRWIVESVFPDLTDPTGCFEHLWNHFADPTAWATFPDVAPCLQRLQRAGVQTAIASNFDGRLHGLRRALPAIGQIPHCLVSSELGYRKPTREFYESALRICGASAAESLFVGDDWEADVLAPRRSGLQAVWLNRRGEESSSRNSIRTLAELNELM